jgi:5-deoxy-glucuronate isomerase
MAKRSDLLVPSSAPRPGEPVVRVTPESAGWEYVGFEVHRLADGEQRSFDGTGREQCLVVLSGRVDASAGDRSWDAIGGRTSVFDGLPAAVYAPAGQALSVQAAGGEAEVALCWSPAGGAAGLEPRAITPDDVEVEIRGSGAMERRVQKILMGDQPAERLLVVEVITPGGHWSSYPPHKHDRHDPPNETFLEETYYHRLEPAQGFGMQRVYTDDRSLDETFTFGDGDVVLVPRGYHTVSAPPGYDLYYLNVMAGPLRDWAFANDPDHAWLFGR